MRILRVCKRWGSTLKTYSYDFSSVCKKWRKLGRGLWGNITKLDLAHTLISHEELEKYLVRCGCNLEELGCQMRCSITPRLIFTYCRQIKTLRLRMGAYLFTTYTNPFVLPQMFSELKDLRVLSIYHPDETLTFAFMPYLPAQMKAITFSAGSYTNLTYRFVSFLFIFQMWSHCVHWMFIM